MHRTVTFVALLVVFGFGAPLLTPCRAQELVSRLVPSAEIEPDQCFWDEGQVNCAPEECQYRCECTNSCPPDASVWDDHPSCCGTGVDCRCPGWPLTDGDFYCNGGYSYCCCHDTCCGVFGLSGVFCFVSPCTWLECYGGCGQWGEYVPPPPDNCDQSGYPDPEPDQCLAEIDRPVRCGLPECAYRCECQN